MSIHLPKAFLPLLASVAVLVGCEKSNEPSPLELMTQRQMKETAERATKQVAKDQADAEALKVTCTKGLNGLVKTANASLAQGNPREAFYTLHPCRDLTTNKSALALYRKAEVAIETQFRKEREATERAEKQAKKSKGVNIGMSKQDALDSGWGKPNKVNRTINSRGVSEQWVYDGGYLYFNDGVLTSIQN